MGFETLAAVTRPSDANSIALQPRTIMQLVTPGIRARRSRRLLVYLHVPFCSSKCHFCDWVVGYDTKDLINTAELRDQYVEALSRQIEAYGPRLQELRYEVTNVYWGGGTPTRLTPRHLELLQERLSSVFDLSPLIEHTAECSPETLSDEHITAFQRGGLNRISIGVQSFNDSVLRRMGRAHNAKCAIQAIELARRRGLCNLNIDLIAGFPDLTRAVLLDSVRKAIELEIPHISLYLFREVAEVLVSVRQTVAGYRRQESRQERESAYMAAKTLLEEAGYDQYMVGYFARAPEFAFDAEDFYFSQRGDYFGFGAGAASTIGRWSLKSTETTRYGNSNVREFVEAPEKMAAAPVRSMPDDVYLQSYFKVFATKEGLRFDRWLDHLGFDFREFRTSRPTIGQWFRDREAEGARFVETTKGISLTPETWVTSMIWRR